MTNGNGWTKWLVATLWSVLVLVMLFMGNTVKANDRMRETEDSRIETSLLKNIDKVKDIVTDIRIEQREQMTILRRIAK